MPLQHTALSFTVVVSGLCICTRLSALCSSGSKVEFVGVTKLPYGQVPLMVYYGDIVLQTSSGKVATVRLETHNFHEKVPQDYPPEGVSVVFDVIVDSSCIF